MPVLILAYPVLVHLAVLLHRTELQWLALCCLAAIPLYPGLRALRPRSGLLLLIAVGALWALTRDGGGRYALLIPPVLLPAVGAWFFGRTLIAGSTPLITRMALLAHRGELPQELRSYTRGVTWLWALLLGGIALLNAGLALWATPEIWSLYTNFLNYLIPMAAFALEYLVRRLRFRHLPHPGFIGFIRTVATTDYRRL
jgi:uncharacterized membrane protein